MRILVYCLLLLTFSSQAQLLEDFSDGNFTSGPAWSGDVTKWQVASQQLQSNSSIVDDIFYLSTVSTVAADAQWECFMRLDFSTSSNNYVDIYVISDNPDLKASLQGYFVRIGNTDDEISLYRRDGTTITKIIDGINGRSQPSSSGNNFKLKLIRTLAGDWSLYDDNTPAATGYVLEGTANDVTYLTSSFLGISIKQSSLSFFNKHFFDDLYIGPIVVDNTPPVLTSATVLSATTVDVKFNEVLENISSQNVLNYAISNAIGNPLIAALDATDKSLVHLSLATGLVPGTIYTLTVNNVDDLSNNPVAANSTVQFALPDTARTLDIIINEILFNPFTGGFDFVEVYNRSSKAIDLKDLQIANIDESTGAVDQVEEITTISHVLLPGAYAVITEDPTIIRSTYTCGSLSDFIDIGNLPTFNDDEGAVILLDKGTQEIDRFFYKDDFHFPLLNDKEGISLERISPERSSQDSSNWHSAAASVGGATPALKNSQYSVSVSDGSEVTISPEVFSPDNDGRDDIVNIHYKFDQPGYTASVKIFSSTGRPVLNLVKSELLGTEEGVWSWDGINEDHAKAPVGIYVLYIEAFTKNGDSKKIKKTCVLGAKL